MIPTWLPTPPPDDPLSGLAPGYDVASDQSPPVAGVRFPDDPLSGLAPGYDDNLPFPTSSPTVEIPTDQFNYPRTPLGDNYNWRAVSPPLKPKYPPQ